MKIINTKYETNCADKNCGATISVGSKVKWYGRGKVYGIGCHGKPEGFNGSSTDQVEYQSGSHKQQYGRCEDAPCCGCCGINSYN